MSVSLVVDNHDFPIGSSDFLHAFFSTVAVRTEGGQWGSRYPTLMRDLHAGHLAAENVPLALDELESVSAALAGWPPEAVVWDADDPSGRPPWGSDIAPSITTLADYFWTADGRALLTVLREALTLAASRSADVTIS